jgi:hypothetical protein
MRRKGEKITTLGALLDAMWAEMGSRKYAAKIHYFESIPECKAEEFFDDGKGHSGAFTSDIAEVEVAIFEEARTKGYVTGVLKPGYVSKTEFVLTDNERLRFQAWDIIKPWREKDYYTQCSAYDVKHGKPGTYIKIVKVPAGEAPEEIRKVWVGMILPCHPLVGYAKWDERERGALSEEQNSRNRYSYAVPQKDALQLLADAGGERLQAANWWKAQGYPKEDPSMDHFSFYQLEAEEFAGTFVHQKVRVHDEMLGGLDH